MENILEVRNLSKRFRDFHLKKISFHLPRGYIMGFIGPNGAGKSTTIKLIMNLLQKDGGEVKLFGLDHLQNEVEVKNRIGFVYDENYFYEDLTINEIIRIIRPLYRDWDHPVFQHWIKEFQIKTRQKIKELSKGMKMKFSLAIALSHHAELLIMDEPTSGLDPVIRSELLDILSSLIQDENKGIFFSTHITSDLEKIADYITFINEGEIILSESKDEILDEYRLVKGGNELLSPSTRELLIGLKESRFGFEGLIKKKSLPQAWQERVLIERPTLEDIMLYTVKGEH